VDQKEHAKSTKNVIGKMDDLLQDLLNPEGMGTQKIKAFKAEAEGGASEWLDLE